MLLFQVIVSGLLLGAVYALFSSGLTLIWGMMNVVNFAHGDFVMLACNERHGLDGCSAAGRSRRALAAMLLATLGVRQSTSLLMRHIMRGPMLAQILGTFGLALLLRYSAFWASARIHVAAGQRSSAAPFEVLGIRVEASRLLAGVDRR